MVASLKPKVADVLSSQLPQVIVDSTDYLTEFLTVYYKWLDDQGVKYIRAPLDIVDIDTASEEVVGSLLSVLLTTNKRTGNVALLVKNIRTLFENKGNLQSYQFLFNLLFGEECELDWGRDHVMSVSSNEYHQNIWITVELPEAGTAEFLGMTLEQIQTVSQNRAIAIIDSQAEVYANGKDLYRFRLQQDTINGQFSSGAVCRVRNRLTGTSYEGTIGHLLGDVEIKNAGSLYLPGDPISLHIGSGVGGSGYVKEISSGAVENIFIIDGGTGYEVGDTIEFQSTSNVTGASAMVTAVGGTGFSGVPVITPNEIVVEAGGSGYVVGNKLSLSNDIGSMELTVATTGSTGKVTGVSIAASGSGYGPDVSLLIYNSLSDLQTNNTARVIGKTIRGATNNISGITFELPSTIIASPKVIINGVDAEAWVSATTGDYISTVSYNPGANYYLPSVYAPVGVSGFNGSVVVDAWGRVTAVDVVAAGSKVFAVTDTAIATDQSSFEINVTTINKYKIGYGVVIAGILNARVTAILYSNNNGTGKIRVNTATSDIVTDGTTITIYPVVLTIKDSRQGSGAAAIVNTDNSAITSVTVQAGAEFNNVDSLILKNITGTGNGAVLTPFYSLKRVDIKQSGKFYKENKVNVEFSDTHGTGADIRAIVANGVIAVIAITTAGTGYTSATIRASNASGRNAVLVPIIQNGAITGINYVDRGYGYQLGDTFIVEGNGSGAVLGDVTVREKGIRKVSVYNSGKGYYPNDVQYDIVTKDENGDYNAAFEGYGAGSGATFTVDVHDGEFGIKGQIKQVNVTNGGSGYNDIYLKVHGQGYKADITPVMVGGSVDSVTVNDSGFAYWWDGSTTVEVFKGVEANLQFVIKGGRVVDVIVLEPGSGYRVGETTISIKQNDIYWDPGDPTTMDYVVPMMDFYSTYPHAYKESVVPVASVKVSSLTVDNIQLQNGGAGYSVIPKNLEVKAVSNVGHGAILIPVISKDVGPGEAGYRRIVDVRVIDPGFDYDENTQIVISGGRVPGQAGADAQLIPIVIDGRITHVDIRDGYAGDHYFYGTKIYVAGNGSGANIVPVVNTGIIRVNVLSQGNTVPADILHSVVDIQGSGAVLEPVWNSGKLSINVVNPGSGYVNPSVIMGSAKFEFIYGVITDITVMSSGSDYSSASMLVQGDGAGAYVTFKTGVDGACTSLNVSANGTRMGGVPKIKLTDTSNRKNISAIRVDSGGAGFFEIPKPRITSTHGTGAVITPYGSKIGAIKSIQYDDFGLDFVDPPFVSSQFRTILANKQNLIEGSKLRIPGSNYNHDNGPFAVLKDIDYQTNIATLFVPYVDIRFLSEGAYSLLSEDGSDISLEGVTQLPEKWQDDVSGLLISPLVDTRFFGKAGGSGIGYEEPERIKSNSVLNDSRTSTTNHYDIQEFAYTIYTGIDIKEYSQLIANILHPAGYQMTGKIRDYGFANCRIKNDYISKGNRRGDIIILHIYLEDDDSRGYAAPVSVEGYVIEEFITHPKKWNNPKNSLNNLMNTMFYMNPVHDPDSLYSRNDIVGTQDIVIINNGITYTLDKVKVGTVKGWEYMTDGGTPMAVWERMTIEEFDTQALHNNWYNPIYMDWTKPFGSEPTINPEKVWLHDTWRVNQDSFVIKQYYTLS